MKPDQLFLPGLISLTRLPDGTAIAKVQEIAEWLTVAEAAERARVGEEMIRGKCLDGTLTFRWKNHVGERGTQLIHAGSLQLFINARVQIGKLHPRFSFAK